MLINVDIGNYSRWINGSDSSRPPIAGWHIRERSEPSVRVTVRSWNLFRRILIGFILRWDDSVFVESIVDSMTVEVRHDIFSFVLLVIDLWARLRRFLSG